MEHSNMNLSFIALWYGFIYVHPMLTYGAQPMPWIPKLTAAFALK